MYIHLFVGIPQGTWEELQEYYRNLENSPEGWDEEYPGALQGGLVQVGAWPGLTQRFPGSEASYCCLWKPRKR